MAISAASLEGKIIAELQSRGFVTEGEHARAAGMASAIAKAVVDEFTANALVVVSSGSSKGNYQVT